MKHGNLQQKLIWLTRSREGQPLRYLQTSLEVAGQLRVARSADVFKDLGEKVKKHYLDKVNQYRERLGASPVLPTQTRRLATDISVILESDAARYCRKLQKDRSLKSRNGLWKKWVFSEIFLKTSYLTPFFDECADLLLELDEREVQLKMKRKKLPRIYRKENAYLDLTPEELFTPYRVLVHCFKGFSRGDHSTFVDLGCGWGRLGFVLLARHPNSRFVGYELVKDRADRARDIATRLGISREHFQIHVSDLSRPEGKLEQADSYFMFNPFTAKTLRKVWRKILPHLKSRPLVIAVLFGQPYWQLSRARWARAVGRPIVFKDWRGKGLQYFRLGY